MRFVAYPARFVAMSAVICWFLVKYVLLRVAALGVARGEPRRRHVAHLRGRILRESFSTLGATFVKLGQVMSTRPDLLDGEVIEELRLLQDRMPPFPGRIARRTIALDLGRPVEAIFAELDDLPVAAASVAQVHRGRLADGTEVAVKVLRPDVRRKVQRDAAIMKIFARLAALHPKIRLSDPVGHLAEFSRGIIEQTDLRGEVANYARFGRNFAGFEGVRFPRVFPELSGPQVMTMEFVRGVKIDQLPRGDHHRLAKCLEQAMFHMCFDHGFLHADLHPGNMVVDEHGALVIFDVGLVKALDEKTFEQFFDFTRCLVMGTAHDFAVHMRSFHHYMGDVDWDGMERDITLFLARFRGRNTKELELGVMFNELYALARRYRVRPLPEIVLIMVGIVTAEGIGKQLHPENNLFESLGHFMLPIMARGGAPRPGGSAPAASGPAAVAGRAVGDQ
jgi:ubiquinone biosynthesis protein